MTKEEYIQLVKTNADARNAALAVAWVVIKTFPMLANPTSEFFEILHGGGVEHGSGSDAGGEETG